MLEPHCPLGPSSVLQSQDWERFQARLGNTVHHLRGPGWHGLAVEETTRLGTVWYLPYGPVLREASALPDALRTLRSRARRHDAAWLRLEPQCPPQAGTGFAEAVQRQTADAHAVATVLGHHRGRPAPRDIQPGFTHWVDLSGPREQILSGMTGTNRNLWRRHRDKGISIEHTTDPAGAEAVIDLLQRTADAKGFTAQKAQYLRAAARWLGSSGGCTTYTSAVEGRVVSALLVYDSPTTRIFAHSGMDPRYRKLRPNQPLIVQALLDAAERGQTVGDLFGVAPPDQPDHPWAGFSAFKRSFGGADAALGGTWDVPVSTSRYRAYRALRAARGGLHHARARLDRNVPAPSAGGATR